jgi:SnoaL-like domain
MGPRPRSREMPPILAKWAEAMGVESIDQVLAVFHSDAVIETASGEHRGRKAIAKFFEAELDHFRTPPAKLYHADDGVACEFGREAGGFFMISEGLFTRLALYSGSGRTPGSRAGEGKDRFRHGFAFVEDASQASFGGSA